MRTPRLLRWSPQEPWEASDESDVAVALIRTAFIIGFALTGNSSPAPHGTQAFLWVMIMLAVAGGFNLGLFGSYMWRRRLPLRRPLALLVDLMLVTAAIAYLRELPVEADWLVALYYVIVMVAAAWFRRIGAIAVALIAAVLYAVICDHVPVGWELLSRGHTVALLLVAVTASYIWLAVDRERNHANRLEYDMALARQLQDDMLPAELPSIAALDVGVQFHPARVVGGDMYDVIGLDETRALLCLGDMAGKSVYGLFHLSLLHSHMHAAVRQGLDPAGIAETINRDVYDALQPSSYAALFIAVADTSTAQVTFVNCGHLPPMLVRGGESGDHVELFTGDIVIGGKRSPEYRQETMSFEPGDVLVCYTDGVTEARDRRGEQFGPERLLEVIRENRHADADELAQAIIDATNQFSADPSADDRAVLAVKVSGGVAEAPTGV